MLRPDGSILTSEGYDPDTRLYYVPTPGLVIADVPEEPTRRQIKRAVGLIEESIGESPYDGDASRANTYGFLLTPIVRPLITQGQTPLTSLDAPQAGTGKGLLADVCCAIATGAPAIKEPAPTTEDEWRKRITANLKGGASFIVIDNVEEALHSAALSAALTADQWGDRELGKSRKVHYAQRATWCATGNNLLVRGDLTRRCCLIRLDAKVPRPDERDAFRIPNLVGWTREHRGELLWALLVMTRAWVAADHPEPDLPRLGSFEDWQRIIGGILQVAGVGGSLANRRELVACRDDSAAEWDIFMLYLHRVSAGTPFSTDRVTRMTDGWTRSDLPEEVCDPGSSQLSPRRLSRALQRRVGKHFAGVRLESAGKDSKTGRPQWCLSGEPESNVAPGDDVDGEGQSRTS